MNGVRERDEWMGERRRKEGGEIADVWIYVCAHI